MKSSVIDLEQIEKYKKGGMTTDEINTVIKHMFRVTYCKKCAKIYNMVTHHQEDRAKMVLDKMQEECDEMEIEFDTLKNNKRFKDQELYENLIYDIKLSMGNAEAIIDGIGHTYLINQTRLDSSEFFLKVTEFKFEHKDPFPILHGYDKQIIKRIEDIGVANLEENEKPYMLKSIQAMFSYREMAED